MQSLNNDQDYDNNNDMTNENIYSFLFYYCLTAWGFALLCFSFLKSLCESSHLSTKFLEISSSFHLKCQCSGSKVYDWIVINRCDIIIIAFHTALVESIRVESNIFGGS